MTSVIDKQIEFISRRGAVYDTGITAEDLRKSMEEEIRAGTIKEEQIDFMLFNLEQRAVFEYRLANNGRLPGKQ